MREFWREPEAIFWVYGFPILMAVGLGIAFRNRVQESFVVDVQHGPDSEVVVSALQAASSDPASTGKSADTRVADGEVGKRVRFEVRLAGADEARRRLRAGRSDLSIVPVGDDDAPASSAPGNSRQTGRRRLQYVFDPTRPTSVMARAAADDAIQRALGRTDVVDAQDVEFQEPGGRYIDFLIPGLIGMNLMGGGLWGVGFVTVDMRIRKLLKRLVATPMRKGHFLAGILISRFLFMIPEVVAILMFARLVFSVRVTGSWLALAGLLVLGAVAFAGIGLLVASRARTLETVSGLMNLVMLPMWLASGIFFSAERFPAAVQPVVQALPLTPLNNALRSVMLEGTSLASLGTEMAILLAYAVVSFSLALRWFRWS